jgi:hypothetical protein
VVLNTTEAVPVEDTEGVEEDNEVASVFLYDVNTDIESALLEFAYLAYNASPCFNNLADCKISRDDVPGTIMLYAKYAFGTVVVAFARYNVTGASIVFRLTNLILSSTKSETSAVTKTTFALAFAIVRPEPTYDRSLATVSYVKYADKILLVGV